MVTRWQAPLTDRLCSVSHHGSQYSVAISHSCTPHFSPPSLHTPPPPTHTELYNRGLIYLNIPIADTDVIVVPPLQGFVMNRVQGDYFETLLYKIFVSIDEHTNIEELASVLQVDPELVKVGVASCHMMEWVWFIVMHMLVLLCHWLCFYWSVVM